MFIKSRYISIAAYIWRLSVLILGICDQCLILCISYAVIPKNSININHESAISNIVFPKNKLIILIITPANNNANNIFPTFVKSNLVLYPIKANIPNTKADTKNNKYTDSNWNVANITDSPNPFNIA